MKIRAISVFRVLVTSIFFLAPLGQAFVYYFSITIPPHTVLTVLAFSTGVFSARLILKPHLIILIYVLLVFYLFIVTVFVSFSPYYLGFALEKTIRSLTMIGPALLVFFVFRSNLNSNDIDETKIYIKAFIFGVIVSVFIAFYLFFTGNIFWGGRLSYSSEYNPAVFGAFTASALILLLGFPRYIYSSKITIIGIAIILIIALVMSQARNSIFGIILGGMIAIYLARRYWLPSPRKLLSAVAFIALIAMVLFLAIDSGFIPPEYYARIVLTLSTDDFAEGTAGRTVILMNYLEWGISAFGYGVDRDAYMVFSEGKWLGSAPHNSYLDILVSGGVLGLGIFLIFLGLILHRSLKATREKRFVMVWLACFWIFIAAGNDTYNHVIFWIPFALWAFLETTDRRKRKILF